MSTQLIVPSSEVALPALIERAGKRTLLRFAEFFTVHISNSNTRQAYARALKNFLSWCEQRGVTDIASVQPLHVASYGEMLRQEGYSVPTVKQHLAAIRELFDWLVEGHQLELNPASSVKGPRYSISKGLTPVLDCEEARLLLESIDVSHVVGLRDRALIGLLTFTFARVSAAVGMNVEDYYSRGKRWRVRLHEKNGKIIDAACHHKLEQYIDDYLQAAGIAEDKQGPLFRAAKGRTRMLTAHAMTRVDAWLMVRRRTEDAGIGGRIGCHTFRATGITAYLKNGGTIDRAQKLAGHASSKTTALYDRRDDEISIEEVERIAI
ncbi:MAG: integrase [Acidobacteria bacterium]|nr:MAG: integrase [Acidobacteriota bacterium]